MLVSKPPLTFTTIIKTILTVWCNHINNKIQPSAWVFLARSILDSTVSCDITKRDLPTFSQISRGQRVKRECLGTRLNKIQTDCHLKAVAYRNRINLEVNFWEEYQLKKTFWGFQKIVQTLIPFWKTTLNRGWGGGLLFLLTRDGSIAQNLKKMDLSQQFCWRASCKLTSYTPLLPSILFQIFTYYHTYLVIKFLYFQWGILFEEGIYFKTTDNDYNESFVNVT